MTEVPKWVSALFRLTRAEYFADFFITPPVTIALAIYSLTHGATWLWPLGFVFGVVIWTVYEYGVHRFAMHGPLWSGMHAMHHENQRDYIAIHPLATLATYAAFWFAFGVHSSALAVGFSCGYIVYAALHTWFHYGRGPAFRALRRRHVEHHRHDNVNYGVVTGFWDRLMGTEYTRA